MTVTQAEWNKLSAKEQADYVNKLMAENARLEAQAAAKNVLSIKYRDPKSTFSDGNGGKVPGKGNFALYGINRQFPITLYAAQWERLIAPDTVAMIQAEIAKYPDAPRK